MTIAQQPRHRAAGAQGFGREPYPSGPVPVATRVADPLTAPITRAALDAARSRSAAAPMPPAGLPYGTPPPVAARNGLGIAGLVLGLCGLVVGLIPLFGIGAILLGLIGLVLGAVGVTRARRGMASNVKTAVTGVVACVLAVALGITGLVIVGQAVDQFSNDMSSLGAVPAAPSAAAPAAAPSAGFGQEFTFSDGMVVGVSAPTAYDASTYAAGDVNPHAFQVTVTLTNNTGEAFDPALLQVAMSTGGAPASQIFDSENDMGSLPQTMLQPGRTMTYDVAFSTTADTGEAQVDVVPSFSYDHAVFTGTL